MYYPKDPKNFVQISSLKHDIAFVMVYAGAHCIHVAGFPSKGAAEYAESSVVEYVRDTQVISDLTAFIVIREGYTL